MADLIAESLQLVSNHCYVLGAAFIVLCYLLNRETRNVPPGPTGLPFVGYIPFLGLHTAHRQLVDLVKTYGSVFSINDYKRAIEFLNHEAIQDRPSPTLITLVLGYDTVLGWKGQLWKEHRRFIFRALRAVGLGTSKVEGLMVNEISVMLDAIGEQSERGSISPARYLATSATNVINSVITGQAPEPEDTYQSQDGVFGIPDAALPFTGYISNFIKYLLPFRKLPFGVNKFLDKGDPVLLSHVAKLVQEQRNRRQGDENANLVAAYLSEYDAKKGRDEFTLLDPKRIPGLAANLVGAGSSTVKDVMEWVYHHCALYPAIQDELVKEIENIVGYDRRPTYADRHNMPYTQAFLWESLRHSSAIPINLPHICSSDVAIGGYTIPKGYHIYVNLWAIHHDPTYWDEPEEFKVERFLTPEGDKLVKHEALIPFSTGRRSCPGEPFAQVELFIYLVMTLQRYRIKPPDGVQLSLDGVGCFFSVVPNNHCLVFENRK